MKYAVVLCDGMADYPVEALGGKTPMERSPISMRSRRRVKSDLSEPLPRDSNPAAMLQI